MNVLSRVPYVLPLGAQIPSVGDRTSGLTRDVDGGLIIANQGEATGPGSNSLWLPAPAGEEFYLALHLYQRADSTPQGGSLS